MPRDRGPFKVNEKVLVPHDDQIYEAKVTKARKDGDKWHYMLHYKGWGKKWDEWLESASILKWTNELAQRVAKGGAVRRKDDGTGEPSSTTDSRREAVLFLNIPQPLKKHLQDQQARITSGASLPPLPADPSVFDILADYRATLSKPTDALTPEEEAALALGAYFDKVLPKRLLYKEEQAQAQEALRGGELMPSRVYGAAHLLRLLHKLPELLNVSHMTTEALENIERRINAVIAFVYERRGEYLGLSDAQGGGAGG